MYNLVRCVKLYVDRITFTYALLCTNDMNLMVIYVGKKAFREIPMILGSRWMVSISNMTSLMTMQYHLRMMRALKYIPGYNYHILSPVPPKYSAGGTELLQNLESTHSPVNDGLRY